MQFKIRDVFLNHPLICFCVIHFLIWGFLPFSEQERQWTVWRLSGGESFVFGEQISTLRCPAFPLMAYICYFRNIKAVYILSQICITVGFCFIYKLASLLLEQRKAVLSVMLLEGCVFMDFVLRNTMLMLCRWLFGLLLHISFTGP